MSSNSSSNNAKGGVGFVGLLQVAFIVLKLCKVIDWPWIMVLCPIWGSILLVVFILTVIYLFMKWLSK